MTPGASQGPVGRFPATGFLPVVHCVAPRQLFRRWRGSREPQGGGGPPFLEERLGRRRWLTQGSWARQHLRDALPGWAWEVHATLLVTCRLGRSSSAFDCAVVRSHLCCFGRSGLEPSTSQSRGGGLSSSLRCSASLVRNLPPPSLGLFVRNVRFSCLRANSLKPPLSQRNEWRCFSNSLSFRGCLVARGSAVPFEMIRPLWFEISPLRRLGQ